MLTSIVDRANASAVADANQPALLRGRPIAPQPRLVLVTDVTAGELFDALADAEDLADQQDAARAHADAETLGGP